MDENIVTYLIRIGLTTLLVGLIGIERETKDKPAGLRTHLLIGVGACSLMLLSIYGFSNITVDGELQIDLSRIPAYVISGLGFLGAGTIIKNDDKIKGLTTAGSIWVVAGIGLIVGAGMYELAIILTTSMIIILYIIGKIENLIERKEKNKHD